MRRRFVTTTCALVLALSPSLVLAQDPQTPPATQQPQQQQPAQPQTPAAPKLTFTAEAGMLLIQIKKDQTAAFEELMAKIRAGVAKTTDEAIKKQMAAFKVYKSSEDMAGNALYVAVIDPAMKDTEYELFGILQKVLTPEELRDQAVIDMSKRAAAAFAQGYNKLNLTPLSSPGGM